MKRYVDKLPVLDTVVGTATIFLQLLRLVDRKICKCIFIILSLSGIFRPRLFNE